jgi:hypothetical protein
VLNKIQLRAVSDKYGSIAAFVVAVQQIPVFEGRRQMTSGTKLDGTDSLEEVSHCAPR